MKKIFIFLFLAFSIAGFAQQKTSYSELIVTNDLAFPKLLKEFYDGARYYKIDYKKKLVALKEIIVIDRPEDYAFLGSVSQDKKSIQMNSMLLQYPALFKIIFFNLMGQVYDLKVEKNSHDHSIMSSHWFMDAEHEKNATHLNKTHSNEKEFFEKLAKIHPLKTSL